jgi:DNA (cytosine-5)-methyltransferase 1
VGVKRISTEDAIRYEFAGTKTEQVKQIGNAVSVAKMKACVAALCADAAPRKRAKPAAEAPAERKAG